MSGATGFRIGSSESRGSAVVEDGTYVGPDGAIVEAYLVRPAASSENGSHAGPGIVAWHWFDTKAPDGDRTQFVDEAVALAADGIVSLLPQGRFPWAADPAGGAADVEAITAEVGRLTAGIDLLADHSAVDPERIGVVGHDFGGMLATLAAAGDERVQALIVIAATPRWGDWFLPFWDIPDDRLEYLRALRPLDPIERIDDVWSPVLFQFGGDDFFIAAMSALEFRSAAKDGAEHRTYPGVDHGMRIEEAVADRRAFLLRHLASSDRAGDVGV
jgi:dienelactone hydrolase